MADQNGGPILRSKHSPGHGNVVFQRNGGILDDADVKAILRQNVVNALPTRAIHEAAMHKNDICRSVFCHSPNGCKWRTNES